MTLIERLRAGSGGEDCLVRLALVEIETLRQQLSTMTADRDRLLSIMCEIAGSKSLTATPTQFYQHLQRIASDATITKPEALAATADLDGLILCHAEPVVWIGTGPRDGRCEFSESKPANSVMRDFKMKPLYARKGADEMSLRPVMQQVLAQAQYELGNYKQLTKENPNGKSKLK